MIVNVRLGFATNSSSTHSIVFLPPSLRGRVRDSGDALGREFGWSHWTAGSAEAKRDYFAITLQYAFGLHRTPEEVVTEGTLQDAVALTRVREVLGGDPPAGAIDHQSVLVAPRTWDEQGPDLEFLRAYERFLAREDVAILGGNDNTDVRHGLLEQPGVVDPDVYHLLPMDGSEHPWVARHDPAEGGYWSVFNRGTGNKVRLAFNRDVLAVRPAKASAPELVDVKITDHCPYGCVFCYQGSTPAGAHAPLERIERLAAALAELRVFEVALGGGEPTLHPRFVEVLAAFRSRGVVPSFTTRSLAWLRDEGRRAAVLAQCGAFAYSVHSAEELAAFAALADDLDLCSWDAQRAHAQYVMGTGDRAAFEALLAAWRGEGNRRGYAVPLTLLGYKRVGRGRSLTAHDYGWWVDAVRAQSGRSGALVGIDTPLAAESKRALDAAGVDDRFYEVREGAFSMYVDAVAEAWGPSSYDPGAMRASPSYDWTPDAVRAAFAAW